MSKRTRNWDKLYNTYKIRYAKQKVVSEHIGVEIEPIYSKNEFKITYQAMEMDFATSGRKVPNLIQNMTRNQMDYKYSVAQARNIGAAIGRLGMTPPKFSQLRKSGMAAVPEEMWDAIRNRRMQLSRQGKNASQIRQIISQTFFGSP